MANMRARSTAPLAKFIDTTLEALAAARGLTWVTNEIMQGFRDEIIRMRVDLLVDAASSDV